MIIHLNSCSFISHNSHNTISSVALEKYTHFRSAIIEALFWTKLEDPIRNNCSNTKGYWNDQSWNVKLYKMWYYHTFMFIWDISSNPSIKIIQQYSDSLRSRKKIMHNWVSWLCLASPSSCTYVWKTNSVNVQSWDFKRPSWTY